MFTNKDLQELIIPLFMACVCFPNMAVAAIPSNWCSTRSIPQEPEG